MDKTDYVLKNKPEPVSKEMVWAFDLGKGSIGDFPSPRWGEGVRRTDEVNKNLHNEFLHKASLLIPAEFAETKTAAGRRRMWRTRQAHGSHRPGPAGDGIVAAASGKEAPCRSSAAVPGCGCGRRLAASSIAGRDVAQASTPAGCGSVPLLVRGRATTRGETPLKPAGGTPALQSSHRIMPRRRRWGALD